MSYVMCSNISFMLFLPVIQHIQQPIRDEGEQSTFYHDIIIQSGHTSIYHTQMAMAMAHGHVLIIVKRGSDRDRSQYHMTPAHGTWLMAGSTDGCKGQLNRGRGQEAVLSFCFR
ncbi:hypothetical protein HRR83_006336 [Exophiala dermatitidis]|uniref:Secreted protein n=1 Tax=Exophiala dermatitidis TaxID=5970 RepID=A0AAN6ENN1_EXODE|nr:hypothetical protein HRR73_007194 [Exophiala dermatitidis]KAJ4509527.1 hypothetical protein HRR74_007308 [Exophiala dermatitidis]KAJ4530528.1 hypothetical protein HRR76_008236 [Exophiala dermatitidis]KAJ4545304.1 hypothetical protein HRR77_005152 [Exophiala dermatitidis]KAJ4570863.1 hypothetical protein HRR79_003793 [Exophiala dermatitidis]